MSGLQKYFQQVGRSVENQDGDGAGQLVKLDADTHPGGWAFVAELESKVAKSNPQSAYKELLANAERANVRAPFSDLAAAHLVVLGLLKRANAIGDGDESKGETFKQCFKYQVTAFEAFNDLYRNEGSWVIPVMRVLISDTRILAVHTDRAAKSRNSENLRETKRLLESCFRHTTMGRATTEDGVLKRRVALYIVNSQFKVFFGLKSLQLCKNLIRQVSMPTFPSMDTFPLGERVLYNYYVGRLFIFEDRLEEAREALEFALRNCHHSRPENKRRIFEFLVPINLFIGRRPAPGLLERFGLGMYKEFIDNLRMGNVKRLDELIESHRDILIERGLYLSIDKLKVVAYRNLFRNIIHVYKITAEKKDRVPLDVFIEPFQSFAEQDPLAFLSENTAQLSRNEAVEQIKCILANLIHSKYVKAYISHEKEMLVLSPKDPFPALSAVNG